MIEHELHTVHVTLAEPHEGLGQAHNTNQAVELARALFRDRPADQEHVLLLSLDNRNRVTGFAWMSSGGQHDCQLDPKILFRRALQLGAAGLILVHNHPSGDSTPSDLDKRMTKKVRDGGELLGLPLLDHIVIGAGNHTSIMEDI